VTASSHHILVVDDDKGMRHLLGSVLRNSGYGVDEAGNAEEAVSKVRSHEYQLVISDILMPGDSGIELLARLRDMQPRMPVVLMTAYGGGELMEHVLGFGAFDYLEKPLDADEVRSVVERSLERPDPERLRELRRRSASAETNCWVHEAPAMQRLFALIRRVADTDSPVLVTGEPGTGKELIARTLHDLGPRRESALVPINCSAVPAALLESELFGHVRGALGGAPDERRGLFEQAHGGTLFLDDIADLDFELQGKLLRVLREGQVRPVGGTRSVKVDVRVVAASHQDLEERIRQGRFRKDLFYGLEVIHLRVPPLRERVEDIPALARAFLRRHARGQSRRLSDAALERLKRQPWPGNARELENVVQRLLVLSDAAVIEEEALLAEGVLAEAEADGSLRLAEAARRGLSLESLTELYIDEMLEVTGGRRGEAARRLGIDRKTLYRRVRGRGPDQEH